MNLHIFHLAFLDSVNRLTAPTDVEFVNVHESQVVVCSSLSSVLHEWLESGWCVTSSMSVVK